MSPTPKSLNQGTRGLGVQGFRGLGLSSTRLGFKNQSDLWVQALGVEEKVGFRAGKRSGG